MRIGGGRGRWGRCRLRVRRRLRGRSLLPRLVEALHLLHVRKKVSVLRSSKTKQSIPPSPPERTRGSRKCFAPPRKSFAGSLTDFAPSNDVFAASRRLRAGDQPNSAGEHAGVIPSGLRRNCS